MNFSLFVSVFCFLIFEWNMPVSADSHHAGKQKTSPCSTDYCDERWLYSVDLLKNLIKDAKSGENSLISPFSSFMALLMVYLGAAGNTQKELEKILRINFTRPSYIPAHLLYALNNSRGNKSNSWEYNSKIELANGLFLQEDIPFEEGFEVQARYYFNANITNVDYKKGNKTADLMNKWISEKTSGRISKFYGEPMDPNTVALLISAVYFQGKWEKTFAESSTKIEKFNTGSAEIDVPMMRNVHVVKYESIPLLQTEVIALDYADRNATMYIFLPYGSQSLKNLTDHLHLFHILEFGRLAKYTWVDYKIPKMKFNWKNSLVDALNARTIFKNPDLSHMTSKSVKIFDMLQATEIEVNENGTTASAAANVQIEKLGAASIPNDKLIKFYVNRPFCMQIIYERSCEELFSGLVYKPI